MQAPMSMVLVENGVHVPVVQSACDSQIGKSFAWQAVAAQYVPVTNEPNMCFSGSVHVGSCFGVPFKQQIGVPDGQSAGSAQWKSAPPASTCGWHWSAGAAPVFRHVLG